MKRIINVLTVLILLSVFTSTIFAQENNAKVQKEVKAQTLQANTGSGPNWVDSDGDGICDNFGTDNQGSGNGNQRGLKDGTKSRLMQKDGTRARMMLKDGTGAGNGTGSGTGICDGTGSQSASKKRGNK